MQKEIGKKLKEARRVQGLTQEQVAEAIGISAKHYGCIERGEVNTTLKVLADLQKNLGFSVQIVVPTKE